MENLSQELQQRKERFLGHLVNEGYSGFLVAGPYNLFYLLGFYHIPTERPVVCFIKADGKTTLFVPSLEEEEAAKLSGVDTIKTYFEYPGSFDLYDWIFNQAKKELQENKIKHTDKIGIDQCSYSLAQRLKTVFPKVEESGIITGMRMAKSELEVEFLKQAAVYADFIVNYGQSHLAEGIAEIELLNQMQNATVTKMIEELDRVIYVPGGPAGGLIPSGPRTALPHALPSARRIEGGDTLILSCGANVMGYRVECERTFFVGEPEARRIEAFRVMKEAQALGVSLMRPGKKCSEIDDLVLKYIKEASYGDYIRHRTGHGKGLAEHEPPWVETGDHTVLQPGMVLSSEPGIYIDGYAGFRHSDTVVITANQPLVLTKFPRELPDVIIEF